MPLLQSINGQLSIRKQSLVYFLVMEQLLVFLQVPEHLLQQVQHLVLDGVEGPLVLLSKGHQPGVFKVDEMPGGLGLGEVQHHLHVCYAELFVAQQQVQDAYARGIAHGLEYLFPKIDVEMFEPHVLLAA